VQPVAARAQAGPGGDLVLHLGCEQGRKPLSILITAGQRGDSPQFTTCGAGGSGA
jgi:hypothetical protein